MRPTQTRLKELHIDNMLFNLLRDCCGVDYADASSYFYQLVLQTFESEPNMIGPNRVPTGKMVQIRDGSIGGRRQLNVVKKVDKEVKSDLKIWVVRGFYPKTGIPFKMVLWENKAGFLNDMYSACKVTLGKLSNRKTKAMVNINSIVKYVEEVSEKTLLDQPTDDIKKPTNLYSAEFRCLTPKNLDKQPNEKKPKKPRKRNKKIK